MSTRSWLIIMALILSLSFGSSWAACSCTRIDPGHVGVSVKKCGGGGVDKEPIPTGYYWRQVICEDVREYPTNLRTIVLSQGREGKDDTTPDRSITVSSSEGLPINADVSLSFTLDPSKVPALYQKYRAEIDQIAATYVRQTVREGMQKSFAKYSAEALYGEQKEQTRAEIQAFLAEQLGGDGFMVSQFTVNEIRVPKQVTDAINAKVAMTQEAQRAEAEVRKTQAVAKQVEAAAEGTSRALRMRADAEAYYNQTVARSLTPEFVAYKAQEKWNGALPQFTGGGPVPFVQVGK